ncbi:MAG: heparinase II/III family protein [Alphaproteobacteria bacterium]|nr:heparinase II/III family protein [Alphaproteobacteria bacterium]
MLLLSLLACKADPVAVDDTVAADTAPPAHEGPLHPELTTWPRLVVLPDDREAILARIHGEAGLDDEVTRAFEDLYNALHDRCAATAPVPEADPYDYGAAWSAAAIARNCAYMAWLDQNPDAAERASGVLLTIPTDASTLNDPTYDVHLSTTLGLVAQTYDLLQGSGLLDDLSEEQGVVAGLAASLHQRYVVDEPLWYQVWQNNHNLKAAAALGQAALVLNDRDESWVYGSYAMTESRRLIYEMTTEAGGYGEGPHYHQYSAQEVIPFLRAWHRSLGDTGEWFDVDCATRPFDTCTEGSREGVGDLWDDPRVQAWWAWGLDLRMPDGQRPPIDDSPLTSFPSAALAEVDPVYAWDWFNQESRYLRRAGDMTAELLSAWDGRLAEPVAAPCRQSAVNGHAVLSTGHGPDDLWFILQAEPYGPMTTIGHEHHDAGAIQLYARGSYLMAESGYAGWDDRGYTSDYAAHSGVLFDGEPPPDGEDLAVSWAPLEGCTAAVDLTWAGATWRRAARLDEDVILLSDTIDAPGTATLQWRLHTVSGEGRGTLALRDWGALLHQDDAALALVVMGDAALSLEEDADALSYGRVDTHQLLVAEVAGPEAALTVALVPLAADAEPEVTVSGDTATVDGRTLRF